MFKIKVLKRGKVIIGDLNLVLKQGDVVDLDERFPRATLDASAHLTKATSGNDPHIAILHKDVVTERGSAYDLASMEERIKQHVAEHIQAMKPAESKNVDLSALVDVLKNHLPANPQVTPDSPKTVSSIEKPIADDKLIDIHTRAVNRLSKNTEGHVSAEKKDIQSDAAKHAKDLEDIF